jgi:hypothetical protein
MAWSGWKCPDPDELHRVAILLEPGDIGRAFVFDAKDQLLDQACKPVYQYKSVDDNTVILTDGAGVATQLTQAATP